MPATDTPDEETLRELPDQIHDEVLYPDNEDYDESAQYGTRWSIRNQRPSLAVRAPLMSYQP